MHRAIAACALAVVLGAALDAPARAQPLAGAPGDGPLDITADSVEFEQGRDLYIARGDVVIRQGERTLEADWVAFNNTTRHGLASGNVVVVDAPDTLYADFLQFNVDTLQGVVYDGTLTNGKTGFRMEGGEVRKTAEQTYEFDDGLFTTCRCPQEGRDPWALRAGSADLEVGGYAVARNTSVEILGLPVLWLPYFIYPLKNERQSGFLFPELAVSSRSGAQVGLPFFWAAHDQVNLIVTPTWASKRGFIGSTRLEYVLGPEDDFGELFASYIPSDDDVDPDDPETPFGDERWGVEFEHVQSLPWWGLELKALGAALSDNEYPFDQEDFSSYNNDRFLESVASLTKHFGTFGSFGGYGAVRWADDLQSPDDRDRDRFLLQRLPELGASQSVRPLPGWSRLVTSFDAQYVHYWNRQDVSDAFPRTAVLDDLFVDTGIDALPDGRERDGSGNRVTADGRIIQPDGQVITAAELLAAGASPSSVAMLTAPDQSLDNAPGGPEGDGVFQEGEPLGDEGHRLLLNPRVALPFRLGDAVEVYPELGYHGTLYETDLQGFEHRSLGTARVEMRSRLRRRFELPWGVGDAEHLLEPRVTGFALTDLSSDDADDPLFVPETAVPQERLRQLTLANQLRDPADRIRHRTGVIVGVANRFYARLPRPEDPARPWLARRLLADVTASVEYRFTGSELGWFVLDGTLYPTARSALRMNFGYDLDETEIGEGYLEYAWSHRRGHDLSARYRYLRRIPDFFEDFQAGLDRFDEFEEEFNRINQIQLGGRLALTPHWALTYDGTYSIEQNLFLTNRGGVEYTSRCRCWAIRVTVEDDRSRGFEFGVEYALLGLGDDTVRPFAE